MFILYHHRLSLVIVQMFICMQFTQAAMMAYFIFRYINYITFNYQWCAIIFSWIAWVARSVSPTKVYKLRIIDIEARKGRIEVFAIGNIKHSTDRMINEFVDVMLPFSTHTHTLAVYMYSSLSSHKHASTGISTNVSIPFLQINQTR